MKPCSASASELAQVASHGAQLAAENAQLRRLLGVTDTVAQSAVVVEVLYEPTSAFNQRAVFNKGSKAGAAPGMPVIDESGVVGQIVRVTPMTAEAALVTDEQVSIPVQLLRGLRLIAFGGNSPGKMEVRYLAANADIKEGDTIVTSGVGGLFPAGLPVAKVTSVERDTASGFARARLRAAGPSRTLSPLPGPAGGCGPRRIQPSGGRFRWIGLTLRHSPGAAWARRNVQPERLDGPAHGVFVWASIILVWLVSLLPWRLWQGAPDVLILIIAFWCAHEPRRVGLFTAFTFGLLMDVRRRPAGRARAVPTR